MDDLLIFGAVILFCGLVVGPLVAIAALRRSAAVRVELAALQRRVEELELRGVAQAPAAEATAVVPTTSAAAIAADAMTAEPSEPRPEPVAEAIDPWRAHPTPQSQPEPTAKSPPESEPPSAFGGMISSLAGWFMQGNPLAKLGDPAAVSWPLLSAALYRGARAVPPRVTSDRGVVVRHCPAGCRMAIAA